MKMGVHSKTRRTDKGARRINRIIDKLSGRNSPYVKVGFPYENSASRKRYKIQKTVMDVALEHEYGTDKLPQRSFMGASFNKEKSKYKKISAKAVNNLAKKNTSLERIFNMMGLKMVADIKNYIRKKQVKPLSRRAEKQGGTTLYDTGQMVNSITYKIKDL